VKQFVPHSEIRKEESSFSEEKEAKRLLFLAPAERCGPLPRSWELLRIKVFCFFSSEKKAFLPC
jgi:hypothetical protein